MAVLVQRMVQPRAAGVAFSANPLTGARGEVVVNATRGLADQLVDGGIDGDAWRVRPGADGPTAEALALPQRALSEADALRVAALAQRVEALRGAPQDIEWALSDGELHLLQARPITVLPVKPAFDAPKGTWEKDIGHFPEPVCPFAASTHLSHEVMRDLLPDFGLLPDSMQPKVIGHEVYLHIEPDDGGAKPPPWWVFWGLVRVIPALRRKMARAREVVRGGLLTELPRRWEEELAPAYRAKIAELAAMDLAGLSDAALRAHLHGRVAWAGESMRLHFELVVPHCVGLNELMTTTRALLGWDAAQTTRLLSGISTASTRPIRELAPIAALVNGRPGARAVIAEAAAGAANGGADRGAHWLARLAHADAEVAEKLRNWLGFWGVRSFGPEISAPNVEERLDLVARSLERLIDGEGLPDLEPARQAAIAEAHAKLQGEARVRFDAALAYAERTYPMREDNVILTDQMIVGLLRRGALELGRRLVARGAVGRVDDVMMLSLEEAGTYLEGGGDARGVVAQRRAELAWVRANPGPMAYGTPSSDLPDLSGLPEEGRRLNEGLMFLIADELSKPPPTSGDDVRGLGASPGTYRGRVRVIAHATELHRLQPGEVLVCPSTTAAWMMVFHRAGAIVTDHGSLLTHTSIVAREHRLPAVVATQRATAVLRDGDEVIVDGNAGTVTKVKV